MRLILGPYLITTLPYFTLPTKLTKKDRIIKRLTDGDDPEIIAREEKTTKNYVYKVGSTGRLKINQESEETKNVGHNNADLSSEYLSTKKGLERTSSLSREERKKLYRYFHDDLSDEEIIRMHGWDPIIVALERVGHDNASGFKPYELQKDLLQALGISNDRVGKLNTNKELISFILNHINYAINQITTNFPENPPYGYSRIICAKCKIYIPGVIYNPSLVPSNMHYLFKTTLCQVCQRFVLMPRL